MHIDMLRKKIDKIDEDIIILLRKRKETAKNISTIKMKANGGIYDKKRESEILNGVINLAERNGLDKKFIGSLFQSIITNSRKDQENDVIKKNQ